MGKPKQKTEELQEYCLLIGVAHSRISEEEALEHLEELRFLAETAGATTERMFLQNLPVPNPKTYVGSGKIEKIRDYVKSKDISLVIFDDELSPSQLRNIEKILECKILDRTILILDIFASRAMTYHAKKLRWNWHNFNICYQD